MREIKKDREGDRKRERWRERASERDREGERNIKAWRERE